jgi:tetratricopeptide (TPR) repeat protein
MDAGEVQRRLNEGIAALRHGERERGRDLLLQVVAADERIEPAWLWLSTAVDDPQDRLIALENVLTLNPNHAQARAQLRELRKQLGIAEATPLPETLTPVRAAPPAGSAPTTEAIAPASPAPPPGTAVDLDDDPYQCAYCGRLTRHTDNRCPHCGRNLLVWGQWGGGCFQYVLLLICGLVLQWGLVQTIGPSIALGIARGIDPSTVIAFSDWLTPILGDFLHWSGALASLLLGISALRLAMWLVVTYLFYNDVESGFAIAVGAALLDLALNGAALLFRVEGLASIPPANMAFDGLVLLFCLPAVVSRSQARVRLRVELDRDAHSAAEFYRRGRRHQRQGRWALAALHWRKAAVLDHREPLYLKALGVAQMRLGRYAKARAALEEAQAHAPNDAEIKALLETARARGK